MSAPNDLFPLIKPGHLAAFRKAAEGNGAIRVACDQQRDSLLHAAARLGAGDISRYLIQRGISVDMPGGNGARPLHYAAEQGHLAVVKTLLQAGASHSAMNANGIAPIHIAAACGHLNMVRLLAENGADISVADKFGRQPIHFAAGANQVEVMRMITGERGQSVGERDHYGQPPLHWAVHFGQIEAVLWLIAQDIDQMPEDIYGRSPWFFAVLANKPTVMRVAEKAMKAKRRRENAYRMLPLHDAVRSGDIVGVHYALEACKSINVQDEIGRTALHMAGFCGNRKMVDWLKKQGADDRIRDDYGWTALKLLSFRSIARRTGGRRGAKPR